MHRCGKSETTGPNAEIYMRNINWKMQRMDEWGRERESEKNETAEKQHSIKYCWSYRSILYSVAVASVMVAMAEQPLLKWCIGTTKIRLCHIHWHTHTHTHSDNGNTKLQFLHEYDYFMIIPPNSEKPLIFAIVSHFLARLNSQAIFN